MSQYIYFDKSFVQIFIVLVRVIELFHQTFVRKFVTFLRCTHYNGLKFVCLAK